MRFRQIAIWLRASTSSRAAMRNWVPPVSSSGAVVEFRKPLKLAQLQGRSAALVKLNGRNLHQRLHLSSPTIDSPAECLTCIDFTGTLAIIAGSGADHVFAEPRIGATARVHQRRRRYVQYLRHRSSRFADDRRGHRRAGVHRRNRQPFRSAGRCCSMAATAPTRCMCAWTARPTRSTARSCFGAGRQRHDRRSRAANVSFHCDTFSTHTRAG